MIKGRDKSRPAIQKRTFYQKENEGELPPSN